MDFFYFCRQQTILQSFLIADVVFATDRPSNCWDAGDRIGLETVQPIKSESCFDNNNGEAFVYIQHEQRKNSAMANDKLPR